MAAFVQPYTRALEYCFFFLERVGEGREEESETAGGSRFFEGEIQIFFNFFLFLFAQEEK